MLVSGARKSGPSGLGLLILASLLGLAMQQLSFVVSPGSSPRDRRVMVARGAAAAAATPEEAARLEQLQAAKRATIEAVEKAAKEPAPEAKAGSDLGVFWVNQPGQISFEVQYDKGDMVKDLRVVIEKITGIPADKQEIRLNNIMVVGEYQALSALAPLNDLWVFDDRDDSEFRGEYNPDPEEDMSFFANPSKVGVWLLAAFLLLFVGTQALEINPYSNFPEGPREDWGKISEELRPGAAGGMYLKLQGPMAQ